MVESEVSKGRFSAGLTPWCDRIGLVRDAVRQELVKGQLARHLPLLRTHGRVLDVGCGQGTQAIALARAGWHVLGLDLEDTLLDVARACLREEADDVRSRVEFRVGDLFALASVVENDRFDVVCCHGVVMYLPSLNFAVAALAEVVAPNGMLSVLSRNRAGIAMRAGLMGDWGGVHDGLESRMYANRLGIADVRADDPEEVADAFALAGCEPIAWYGVRLLTDHWGDMAPPPDLDAIVAAEEAVGQRDPYRRLAALTHTIGTKVRAPSM